MFKTIISKKQGVLNHVSFNQEEPVLVVGDNRGHVHTLKLSPNLRKRSKESQAALISNDTKLFQELELRKLESVVGQVMEPLDKDNSDSDPDC